ncbi:MAG: hypothetical protein ABS903_17800 [Solibacillus sp.]
MAKNPILQKKFEAGHALGHKEGIAQSTAFFVEKFKALEQMPGVGPKTLEALGKQYFK